MHLRGGQAPGSTEFFSLECWHGQSNSRGIYVHNGAMLYVTRHSKARKATNEEFQVAPYLSGRDSVALARYLTYIRPFANMIYRSCYQTDCDRSLLFSPTEDPSKPWKASSLTSALKNLSNDVAGLEFGIQVYRQLSITITARHISQLNKPFNRYDDKTEEASPEVSFAWQSGHRPIQRGTTYGIDAAYPDSLQPALLRVYRCASSEWQHFLDQVVNSRVPATSQEVNAHDSPWCGKMRGRIRVEPELTTQQYATW